MVNVDVEMDVVLDVEDERIGDLNCNFCGIHNALPNKQMKSLRKRSRLYAENKSAKGCKKGVKR